MYTVSSEFGANHFTDFQFSGGQHRDREEMVTTNNKQLTNIWQSRDREEMVTTNNKQLTNIQQSRDREEMVTTNNKQLQTSGSPETEKKWSLRITNS